jgi:hypothetical protein
VLKGFSHSPAFYFLAPPLENCSVRPIDSFKNSRIQIGNASLMVTDRYRLWQATCVSGEMASSYWDDDHDDHGIGSNAS